MTIAPGQYRVCAWPEEEDDRYTDADLSGIDGGWLVSLEYFYAVHGDDATRRGYLDRAHALGREF